jgi:hypothetical protein
MPIDNKKEAQRLEAIVKPFSEDVAYYRLIKECNDMIEIYEMIIEDQVTDNGEQHELLPMDELMRIGEKISYWETKKLTLLLAMFYGEYLEV